MFELDLDKNTALIERAAEYHAEAQRQRALGTVEGYETAITLSEEAAQLVSQARSRAASLPEKAQALSDLLDALSAETLGDWRDRACRARERLQPYSKHWTPGLASDAKEALAGLDQVELNLGRISADVRERRFFRQSEIDEAIEILSDASERMDEARERIRRLASEAQRIEDLRRGLREAAEEINRETLPELSRLSERMLPEVRQGFDAVLASFQEGVSLLEDPAGVDLDEATSEWLPSVRSELGKVRAKHEKSQNRYRRILKKVGGSIDRKWARLTKMRSDERPRLKKELDRLARDVSAWRCEAEEQADSPLALRDLLEGRARVLEARIEEIHRQAIVEGRRRAPHESFGAEHRHAEKAEILENPLSETCLSVEPPPTGGQGREAGSGPGSERMSVGLSENGMVSILDDTRYREGMSCLQNGKWPEAADRFQELLDAHPGSELARRALDEARFKAKVDATAHVRPKQWVIPWGRLLFYFSVVVLTGLVGAFGTYMFRSRFAPVLAEARAKRQVEQRWAECTALREAGDLDAAEACFQGLLSLDPQDQRAQLSLQEIAEQRGLEQLYQEGLGLEAQGEGSSSRDREGALRYYEAALQKYTEILRLSPLYRDVPSHITAIEQRMRLVRLFGDAEADFEAGRPLEALEEYLQVRELNNRYERDLIDARLFDIYLGLGREIIERSPATPEMMPRAREYFEKALRLAPRSAEAALEKRQVSLFIEGQTRYYQGYSDEAIARLGQVYEQRPGYLHGLLIGMLYDAYIRSGDAHQASGDVGFAYEQYRRAVSLPLADRTLALERLEAITPYLTPTPTPTATPTPTSTPVPTPTPRPTPIPTPKPLVAYRNYIAFYSDNEEQPGIWVMDPSGKNRQYLGRSSSLRRQYDALIEEARYSPDHRYYLFVKDTARSAQIFVLLPRHEQYGDLPPEQLTKLSGLSYDPVWSPDGSRVAFVSQENESDDIWVINADGATPRNLTRNTWEWDKHPSWSPDSRRIAFWSNRDGRQQIYVMDADGRDVRNISNTEWNEYNSLWIR